MMVPLQTYASSLEEHWPHVCFSNPWSGFTMIKSIFSLNANVQAGAEIVFAV